MKKARTIRPIFRSHRNPERGTSLLEFALLVPLLTILLLGVIEVGRFADAALLVADAARAGAQYGAQNLTTAADVSGIANAAQQDVQGNSVLNPVLGTNGLQAPSSLVCRCDGVSEDCGTLSSCTGDGAEYVQVIASGKFVSLFSFPGLPGGITLNSTYQIRVPQ
jgi:Flp pilus assembly protein TadG